MQEINGIVQSAIDGNAEAFEELCAIKGRNIIYLCMKIMGNNQDGEDAGQEVFIRLQKEIKLLKNPLAFDRWLYLLIQSTCNNMRKKNMKTKGNVSVEEYEDILLEEKFDYLPQDFVENSESRKQLMKIINKMPYNMRMSVVLFYYESYSQAEIASTLSLSVTTVKSLLYKARIKIRKEIERIEEKSVQSKTAMPMVFLGELFTKDAVANVSTSVVESCSASAVAAAFAEVGVATAGTAAAITTISTSIGLTKIVTVALSVALVGASFTAAIVLAGNDKNTSNPVLLTVSDSAPQHMEQAEQSAVEDISSSEEVFVQVPSQPVESDSTQVEIPQTDSAPQTNTDIDNVEATFTINGKLEIKNREGLTVTDSNGYLQKVGITLLLDGKKISHTYTNKDGQYTFANIKKKQGEYQIQVTAKSDNMLSFSSEMSDGKKTIVVNTDTATVDDIIYLQDNVKPSVALMFYDSKGNGQRENPNEIRLYINDATATSYKLSVFSKNSENSLVEGDVQEINEFLASKLVVGQYTVKAVVKDAAGNESVEQLDFYIV